MTKEAHVITWKDVGVLASQIERETHRHVEVKLTTVSSSPVDGCMTVVVSLVPLEGNKSLRKRVNAISHYPIRGCKSMGGLMVKLLYMVLESANKQDAEARSRHQLAMRLEED